MKVTWEEKMSKHLTKQFCTLLATCLDLVPSFILPLLGCQNPFPSLTNWIQRQVRCSQSHSFTSSPFQGTEVKVSWHRLLGGRCVAWKGSASTVGEPLASHGNWKFLFWRKSCTLAWLLPQRLSLEVDLSSLSVCHPDSLAKPNLQIHSCKKNIIPK